MSVTSSAQVLHPLPWGQLSDPRLNGLRLWQLVVGQGRLPTLRIRRDPVAAEVRFRELLTEKGEQRGEMALALEFPFELLPPCARPSSGASRQAVRTYLDHLLLEAARVGDLLRQHRTVTHLYWLGDPSRWLSRGEMTELMYRLGQYFHLRRELCHCTVMHLNGWPNDSGLFALLRGLGFSHLLLGDGTLGNRQTESTAALSPVDMRHYWHSLHLKPVVWQRNESRFVPWGLGEPITGEPSLDERSPGTLLTPDRHLLVGLGVGAWSLLDQHLIHNASRLDLYYGRLAQGRLPSLEAGSWQKQESPPEAKRNG